MQQHNKIGFLKRNSLMIPNGFDLQKFFPDQERRQQLRKDLGIAKNTLLVGHISRFHPMKDHVTLLRAIDRVMENISDSNGKQEVIFLLIGNGLTSALSTNPAIRFLGERADISNIMSALDILVSSSAWGEGFPNVIGEAMASEVPCVVTDVGDSAYIVGDYGVVCPVRDGKCIADSMMQLIENRQQRKTMGQQARQRIKQNYSMDKIKKEYLQVWGF